MPSWYHLDLPFDPGIVSLFALSVGILTGIIHVLLAIGVARDGFRVKAERGRLELVGVFTWSLATLLGGVVAAVAYWLLHRSALRVPSGGV